jgi:putative membrane protein
MNPVVQVFALLGAVIHLLAFVWEVILFERPTIHERLFRIPSRDVPAVRLWSFNVGFYNLFLAGAPIAGVVLLQRGQEAAGTALVLYGCVFMFLAGTVLLVSDRLALSRPRGSGVAGALSQSLPPLIALVAAAV